VVKKGSKWDHIGRKSSGSESLFRTMVELGPCFQSVRFGPAFAIMQSMILLVRSPEKG
jgi:hypothetical protein